jgi:hypothetical protein
MTQGQGVPKAKARFSAVEIKYLLKLWNQYGTFIKDGISVKKDIHPVSNLSNHFIQHNQWFRYF